MVDRFTRQQKIDILLWELWNETSYPLPGVDDGAQNKQDKIMALLRGFKNGGHPRDEWNQWYVGLGKKADGEQPDGNDTVTMERAEWEAIEKHMEDLERSAASAREIARAAMSSTGTRAMRVELVARDDGVTIIVCDPAGDEVATAKRMAGFLGFIIDRQEAKSIGIQVVSPIEPIQKPIDALIPHLNKLTLVGQFCSE